MMEVTPLGTFKDVGSLFVDKGVCIDFRRLNGVTYA